MQISIHSEIKQIPRKDWNTLVTDNNPFMRHEFLSALENNGCVSDDFGWRPCHIAITDAETNNLLAAMPMYSKLNSYGEFVFDHAWADAYQRNQIPYFPKLVSSIPYTPASGQRLLYARDISKHDSKYSRDELYSLLIKTVQQFATQQNYSSFHCLFANKDEQDWLEDNSDAHGLLSRNDCQFHWHNENYNNFDDFLAKLNKKKRKNIRQERRRVEQQNIKIRVLNGHTATEQDWKNFSQFYDQTFAEKYGTATLNEGFFKEVAQQLPDQTLLVLADNAEGECIAGSLMYASDTILYGRHWGCIEQVDKLHFEACYYQGIEYCIEHGLLRFEPGAQGEHKIARGFIPTLTRSTHWLNNSPFQTSIDNFVVHEKQAINDYMKSLKSPYSDASQQSSQEPSQ